MFYTEYSFEAGSFRKQYQTTVEEVLEQSVETTKHLVQEHVQPQIVAAETRLNECRERYTTAVQTAIDARISRITENASTMQRVSRDINLVKGLMVLAQERKASIDATLNAIDSGTVDSRPTVLSVPRKEGLIETGSLSPVRDSLQRLGSGKLRYVPPMARFQAQDAHLAEACTAQRADSVPLMEITDSLWESPKGSHRHRDGRSSQWRHRNSAGTGISTGNGSGQFSPRSNFFRNFEKTNRGGRSPGSVHNTGTGRGQNAHRRSGSWN